MPGNHVRMLNNPGKRVLSGVKVEVAARPKVAVGNGGRLRGAVRAGHLQAAPSARGVIRHLDRRGRERDGELVLALGFHPTPTIHAECAPPRSPFSEQHAVSRGAP